MRFLHIADLHLGKVIHGVSMLENGDQRHWVEQFLSQARQLRPDAVLISGDVYDRSSPAGAAVELLSHLMEELTEQGIAVLLIAGNHDSGQRLSFARGLLARQQVHIAGTVDRQMTRVTLEDDHGPVTFWLMPYLFPAAAAQVLGDDSIRDYDTAVRRLLAEQDMDKTQRNVLLAHQNVTVSGRESERGGSESMVGGVGQVDCTAFASFDYVALGHIHAGYPVGREEVRYAGTPLCYHFNETRQGHKGFVLVELGPKGAPPQIQTVPIAPLHPMRELKGPYEERLRQEKETCRSGEYLRLVLTDRPMTQEISDRFEELARERGSILMERSSEYRHSPAAGPEQRAEIGERSVEELFADFYAAHGDGELSPEDTDLLAHAGELLRSRPDEDGDRLAERLLDYLMKQGEVRA